MSVMNRVVTSVLKRAAYKRIKSELEFMSQATAIDLGMFPEDAAKTAHTAVYG